MYDSKIAVFEFDSDSVLSCVIPLGVTVLTTDSAVAGLAIGPHMMFGYAGTEDNKKLLRDAHQSLILQCSQWLHDDFCRRLFDNWCMGEQIAAQVSGTCHVTRDTARAEFDSCLAAIGSNGEQTDVRQLQLAEQKIVEALSQLRSWNFPQEDLKFLRFQFHFSLDREKFPAEPIDSLYLKMVFGEKIQPSEMDLHAASQISEPGFNLVIGAMRSIGGCADRPAMVVSADRPLVSSRSTEECSNDLLGSFAAELAAVLTPPEIMKAMSTRAAVLVSLDDDGNIRQLEISPTTGSKDLDQKILALLSKLSPFATEKGDKRIDICTAVSMQSKRSEEFAAKLKLAVDEYQKNPKRDS